MVNSFNPKMAVTKMRVSAFIAIGIAILLVFHMRSSETLIQRIKANENYAIGELRHYAAAQAIYKKANCSSFNVGKSNWYCSSFANMGGSAAHKDSSGSLMALLRPKVADSTATTPCDGYIFINDALLQKEWENNFGLFAVPAIYGKTGYNQFYINSDGYVYMKDTGNNTPPLGKPFDPVAAGWERP